MVQLMYIQRVNERYVTMREQCLDSQDIRNKLWEHRLFADHKDDRKRNNVWALFSLCLSIFWMIINQHYIALHGIENSARQTTHTHTYTSSSPQPNQQFTIPSSDTIKPASHITIMLHLMLPTYIHIYIYINRARRRISRISPRKIDETRANVAHYTFMEIGVMRTPELGIREPRNFR